MKAGCNVVLLAMLSAVPVTMLFLGEVPYKLFCFWDQDSYQEINALGRGLCPCVKLMDQLAVS